MAGGGRRFGQSRYERAYSNSMWHAGYKRLDDGRWLFACQDDASRFITGFGASDEATGEHALCIIREASARHGSPSCVVTGHGRQFYSKSEGGTAFERGMVELGIRHVLAQAGRSYTNGKLARFYWQLQRSLPVITGSSVYRTSRVRGPVGRVGDPFCTHGPRDPIERFVDRYNNAWHMALDRENRETPAQAFARRAAPAGGQGR